MAVPEAAVAVAAVPLPGGGQGRDPAPEQGVAHHVGPGRRGEHHLWLLVGILHLPGGESKGHGQDMHLHVEEPVEGHLHDR